MASPAPGILRVTGAVDQPLELLTGLDRRVGRRAPLALLPGVSRRTGAGSRSVTTAVLPRGTGYGTGAGETLGTQGILSGRGGPSVQAGHPGRGTGPLV